MKPSLVSIAIQITFIDALISRATPCCFHLNSTLGSVGQLNDGQNRLNQTGLPTGQYCIDANGGLTDHAGRGCILTPPTTQFQCDTGATPSSGFSVSCSGALAHNNNTVFFACPTGDNGGFNIYTTPPTGQQGCVVVPLTADACQAACPAPASTTTPTPAPSATATSKTCPLDLSGKYEYPHLIVPIDSSKPTTALGTSYNGTVSTTISSIYNFDIQNVDNGKTCSLFFLFPMQSQLQTSSFTLSGSGEIDFYLLNSPATINTTFASAPTVKQEFGMATFAPGHTYSVAAFPCPGGTTIGIEAESCGGTYFDYFQDYNSAP